jgi:hypothetical protein
MERGQHQPCVLLIGILAACSYAAIATYGNIPQLTPDRGGFRNSDAALNIYEQAHSNNRRVPMNPFLPKIVSAAVAITLVGCDARAHDQTPTGATSEPKGTFLLSILLRNDQSRPPEQTNSVLLQHGFYKAFPPPGTEVVSWYELMGIGQIVTLRIPAERLREVNHAIDQTAWGIYHTEFYPTYDLKGVAEQLRTQAH